LLITDSNDDDGGDRGLQIDEKASSVLPVGITELDLGEGGATTGVVDNLLDDSANVTGTLGEIEGAQLGGTLAQTSVRLENSSGTLTLSTNDTTHFLVCETSERLISPCFFGEGWMDVL